MNKINLYNRYTDMGFKFPDSFLSVISVNELLDLQPWRFLWNTPKYLNGWIELLDKSYPERKLIPFARWDDTDDLACFEATDLSKNPKVHYVHAYASAGWEDKGSVEGFDKWLEIAKEDSILYKSEQVESDEEEN